MLLCYEPSVLLTPKRPQIGTDSGDQSDRLLMVGYNGCVLHSHLVLFIVAKYIDFAPVAKWQDTHSNPFKYPCLTHGKLGVLYILTASTMSFTICS